MELTKVKVFGSAVVFALIAALPVALLYDYAFPSSGSFGFNLLNNPFFAAILGFMFTLPFMLGLLGTFWFKKNYRSLSVFVILPAILINLISAIDGLASFIFALSISIFISLIGFALANLIMFLRGNLGGAKDDR